MHSFTVYTIEKSLYHVDNRLGLLPEHIMEIHNTNNMNLVLRVHPELTAIYIVDNFLLDDEYVIKVTKENGDVTVYKFLEEEITEYDIDKKYGHDLKKNMYFIEGSRFKPTAPINIANLHLLT